ncbi:MAG: hypothetical protein HKN75_08665, partial [Bacteroidia bacterium]|nr:hypothetical protein [Bacteroidia bacterium]
MKKNKNLLKAMTLLVIFSIVSCQKDDITEDLVYSSDPSASQRSSHVECVDFETPQLYAGEVVTKHFTNSGLKDVPIFVYGVNPNLSKGTNAAMIFDSSNPSPADADLGSPHRRFGGPGLGAAGAVEPFANKRKLGKILIISDDMNEDNPSDLESTGRIVLDFRSWGMFKLHSLTVIDVEGQNGQPTVELLDANDEVLR